jgi:uncharacterized protein (TIGR02186 family)
MGWLRVTFICLLCVFCSHTGGAQVAGTTEPGIVETGASQSNFFIEPSYDGTTIAVFGAIDRERLNGEPFDVVVTIHGPLGPLTVWKKDRRFGLWMNSQRMEFQAVPNFYAVLSTKSPQEIAPLEERKIYGIGLDALGLAPRPAGEPSNPAVLSEFELALVRLKQRSGLFVVDSNAGIVFFGERLFRARTFLPATAGPGLYRAESYVIQKGKVVGTGTSQIRVAKIGIEARLSSTAISYPWLYGVLAVLMAAAVGTSASFLLGRK